MTVLSLRIHPVLTACALLASFYPAALEAQTALSDQQAAVVRPLEVALKAAQSGDVETFNAQLAPGFYIYDGGKRFDAAGIIAMAKSFLQSGLQYRWQVTSPDVHIDHDTAWVAYVNNGSVTAHGTVTKRQWLESAVLTKTSGSWKIAFWHSTPVPAPK